MSRGVERDLGRCGSSKPRPGLEPASCPIEIQHPNPHPESQRLQVINHRGETIPMTRIYRIMGRPVGGSKKTILKDGFTDRMDAVVYKDTEQSAGRMDPKAYVTSRIVKSGTVH